MATWHWILIRLVYGSFMFVFGAWWRANFADEPLPTQPIPADDTYGRTSRYMMEGR
jgi:hypothetical protein